MFSNWLLIGADFVLPIFRINRPFCQFGNICTFDNPMSQSPVILERVAITGGLDLGFRWTSEWAKTIYIFVLILE